MIAAKLKKIGLNLLLMSISLLVAALIGEFVLRMTMKDSIVLFPRYHTDAEYGDFRIRRFRPSSEFWHQSIDGRWYFRTDARGLRNSEEVDYANAQGAYRVLALGDSHTAGYEVGQDETFSALLQRQLREDGLDAQVINAGISGFGTAEQLVYLENEGLRFQPDLVVVGFYANDFEDNVKSGLYSLEGGELAVAKQEHLPGVRIQNMLYDWRIIRWLSENSYFYSFVFNAMYELAKKSLAAARQQEAQTDYAIPTGDFDDYQYELAARLLTRIVEVCRSNDVDLLIIDIPRPDNEGRLVSSFSEDFRPLMEPFVEHVAFSDEIFAPLVAEEQRLHVPHGHRHISPAAHSAIAATIETHIGASRSSTP